MRHPHVVSRSPRAIGVSDLERTFASGPAELVRARVEPLPTEALETIVGRIAGARWRITWAASAASSPMRDGEEIKFDDLNPGDPTNGATYTLAEVTADITRRRRNYYTAILTQEL